MVNKRRSITNEQEKYGVSMRRSTPIMDEKEREALYDLSDFDRTDLVSPRQRPSYVDSGRESRYADPEYTQQQEIEATQERSFYSGRPTAENQRVGNVTYPTRAKRSERRNVTDFMPNIEAPAAEAPAMEEESKARMHAREKTKLEAKTKIMLAVYMVAVIALAAVVIATGIAISDATASVNGLESIVAEKNAVVVQQTAEIARLSDDDTLAGKAVNSLGMSKVTSVQEIALLETEAPVKYQGRTNWFDQFCDWLSGVLGG